jgi:predicted Zn-dependent protease
VSIDPQEILTALDILGPGSQLSVSQERVGLLRYARSAVTAQHSEERLQVRVRLCDDGRAASGTLETLDPAAVRGLAGELRASLRLLPATERPLPAAAATAEVAAPVAVGAATVGAAERYAMFDTIRRGLGTSARLGGSIRHDVADRVVAGHDGLYRAETLTKTSVQAIAEQDDRSASVRLLDRDAARIDVTGVPGRLLADLEPLPSCAAMDGACRVVLRPQAVVTLLATYGFAALGAAAYATGGSAVSGMLGEPVASELITLTDDGTCPDGLASGFDPEGTPRRRTPLIDRGVLTGVVSNLEHAAVTGGVSTGHGVPAGWRFGAGPSPSHLLLEPGAATEADLVAACGDGLLVTRLDYLRILHPKDTLVTGTTRDGTYKVQDGRVVAWHPPVRLTFRMDEVLRAVVAVGQERERGETPFMESIVAPALLIDAGPLSL